MRRRRRRTTLKKLRIAADEAFGSETAKFLEIAQARLRREGASNSEWIETGLKAALFADARGMIESLLNDPQVEVAEAHKLTGEKRGGMKEKTVQSMFGSIRLRREYFTIRDGVAGVIRWTRLWGWKTVTPLRRCG